MPSLPLRCLSIAVVLLAASTGFAQTTLFADPGDDLASPDLLELIRQRSLEWNVVHLPIPEMSSDELLDLPELILTEATGITAEPPAAPLPKGEPIPAPKAPPTAPLASPTAPPASPGIGVKTLPGTAPEGNCCGGAEDGLSEPGCDAPSWACYPPCCKTKKCFLKCRQKKCCQPCGDCCGFGSPYGGDMGDGSSCCGGFDGFDSGCCSSCCVPCCKKRCFKKKRCCGGCCGMPYGGDMDSGCGWGSYYGAFAADSDCCSGCCGRKRRCKSCCGCGW